MKIMLVNGNKKNKSTKGVSTIIVNVTRRAIESLYNTLKEIPGFKDLEPVVQGK